MKMHDLAELLRLKRALEARAVATLAKARAAERQGQEALNRANLAEAAHRAARSIREAEIYAKLLAGPLPTTNVQAATVRLGRLAAQSGALRRHVAQAGRDAAARTAAVAAAQGAQLKATRAVEAAGLLHGQISEVAAAAAESGLEDEMDELAALRPGNASGRA